MNCSSRYTQRGYVLLKFELRDFDYLHEREGKLVCLRHTPRRSADFDLRLSFQVVNLYESWRFFGAGPHRVVPADKNTTNALDVSTITTSPSRTSGAGHCTGSYLKSPGALSCSSAQVVQIDPVRDGEHLRAARR